ncbi:MAG: peptidylprolyl isomerase [Candidatus Delongbacteria bacterium]|jgi:peptidyl-prolyl cis-trans isomerase D|nr:peptidylprolyl isomerase [Candidatus Delongbacteria bacterium]
MIRTIREKLSFVMWIVVAAFIVTIIFSWGMGGIKMSNPRQNGTVAKINGEGISYDELKNIEQSLIKKDNNEDLSGVKIAELKQKAWDQFVQMVALRQEMAKNDITVSNEQIYFEIRNNPLNELRSDPQFQTDGVFDIKKWHEVIDNPKPELEQFYAQLQNVYANRIPGMLLESRVANGTFISDYELITKYKQEKLTAKVKFLKADIADYMPADSMITDKEIEDYYNANAKEFPNRKEQRVFDYVLFSTEMTKADSSQTLDDINYALKQINTGIAFENVAKNYSEDGSAEKGGDLGFFGKGQMVPEFEEAAFNAEVGEIVGPVKTQYGYHIIKVVAKKKDKKGNVSEVKANHVLIKFKVYQETFDVASDRANNFKEAYKVDGKNINAFKEAADQMNKKILESPLTYETDRTNELGKIPGLGKFLFNNEIGEVSNLLTCDKGYVYLEIKEIKPESKKTLDEVRKSIIYKIRRERGLELAYEQLKSKAPSVKDTTEMNELAAVEDNKLTTGLTNNFAMNTFIDAIGSTDRVFYETAMMLESGQISEPFKGDRSAFVICLLSKDAFNEKDYNEGLEAYREKELSMLRRQIITEWLQGVVEKADVVDYRDLYGR